MSNLNLSISNAKPSVNEKKQTVKAKKAKKKKSLFGTERVRLAFARSGETGRLVPVSEASRDVKYFCPFCGKPVFPKMGKKQEWCYRHFNGDACEPEEGALANFVCELVALELEKHHRIMVPGICYRTGGRDGLQMKEPEIINFRPEGEIREIRGEAKGRVMELKGRSGERKYAFLISTSSIPNKTEICRLDSEGYEALLVDAFSVTLTDKGLTEAIEELLLETALHKEWVTGLAYPKSLEAAIEILPASAFTDPEDECNMGKTSCSQCKFCCMKDGKIKCCHEYVSNYDRRMAELTALPEPLAKMDTYKRNLSRAKKESSAGKKASRSFLRVFERLSDTVPNPETGACLAGVCPGDLNGQSSKSNVYWGFGTSEGSKTIILEPDGTRKSATRTALKFTGMTDYVTGEFFGSVHLYTTRANASPESALQSIEAMRDSGWEEIADKKRINQTVKNLVRLTSKISWSCSEVYELLIENLDRLPKGRSYKENPGNIKQAKNIFVCKYHKGKAIGRCAFAAGGDLTGAFSGYGFGADWNFQNPSTAPIRFVKLDAGEVGSFYKDADCGKEITGEEFRDAFNLALDICSDGNWSQVGLNS